MENVVFTLSKEDIFSQLLMQLKSFFFVSKEEVDELSQLYQKALDACIENFSWSPNKYFTTMRRGVKTVRFDPYHSVQYMIFLYYLSHFIYVNGKMVNLPDKLYYLNKIFHSVDLFYAIELPKHFGAEHPLGSVMGRAKYGDNFYFFQNCTVGGTMKEGKEVYPIIGNNVQLCCNSSILGECYVGDNVIIGAGAMVKNQNIPNNSIVFGSSPNLIIKDNKHNGILI